MKIVTRTMISRPGSGSVRLALARVSALFAFFAIGMHLPASAEDMCRGKPSATARSTAVALGDLDLSSEQGMLAARNRLHEAARRLCGQVVDPWSLSHQPDYVKCVDATMAAALAKIGGPSLASLGSRD